MGNCSENCTTYCKGKSGETGEFDMADSNPTATQVQVQRPDNVGRSAAENQGDSYGKVS
jgi:hypothetical protein